jgi:hypothetical protein
MMDTLLKSLAAFLVSGSNKGKNNEIAAGAPRLFAIMDWI